MCGVLCGECKDIIKIQGKSLLIPLLLLAVNVFATIWGYSNMGVVKMLLALNGIFACYRFLGILKIIGLLL